MKSGKKAKVNQPANSPYHIRLLLTRRLFAEAVNAAAKLRTDKPSKEHDLLLKDALLQGLKTMSIGAWGATWSEEVAKQWLDLASQLDCLTPEEQSLLALRRSELTPIGQGDSELSPTQIGLACDVALRSPSNLARLPESLQVEVELVRSALTKIESGEGEAALEMLQPIGFRSPLAPWRVFARGLIAFYQKDFASASSAWSKIPVDRTPARIAAYLLKSVDQSVSLTLDEEAVRRTKERLSGTTDGESRLMALAACMVEDRIFDLDKVLRGIISSEEYADAWKLRLVELIWAHLVSQPQEWKGALTIKTPGPSWDRGWDLVKQVHAASNDIDKLIDSMKAFLDKSSSAGTLAISWSRALVAVLLFSRACNLEAFMGPNIPIESYKDLASRLVLESARLKPNWNEVSRDIARLIEYAPHPMLEEAIRLYCDGSSTACWIHYLWGMWQVERKAWDRVEEFIGKGIEGSPRDPVFQELWWHYFETRVFEELLAKNWSNVERLLQMGSKWTLPGERWRIGWVRCIMAIKRKDSNFEELFESWIADGTERLTATWLMEWACVHAKLPAASKAAFKKERAAALKTKSIEAALQLANRVAPRINLDYSGSVTHCKDFGDYLTACIRGKKSWAPLEVHQAALGYWWISDRNRYPFSDFFARLEKDNVYVPGFLLLQSELFIEDRARMKRDALTCSQANPELALPSCIVVACETGKRIGGFNGSVEKNTLLQYNRMFAEIRARGLDEHNPKKLQEFVLFQQARLAASKDQTKFKTLKDLQAFAAQMNFTVEKLDVLIHDAYEAVELDEYECEYDDDDDEYDDDDDDDWE